MGYIDVRKGIFNTLLTMLWQSMQSCTDESHSIKIYRRDHRQLGGVTRRHTPLLATPLIMRLSDLEALGAMRQPRNWRSCPGGKTCLYTQFGGANAV